MRNNKNSIIETERDLNEMLKKKQQAFVLFYASWCPFSRQFFPIFENCADEKTHCFLSVKIDDLPEICDKYSIDVYPTVLFFENGMVIKRLDGVHGIGLNKNELYALIDVCEK